MYGHVQHVSSASSLICARRVRRHSMIMNRIPSQKILVWALLQIKLMVAQLVWALLLIKRTLFHMDCAELRLAGQDGTGSSACKSNGSSTCFHPPARQFAEQSSTSSPIRRAGADTKSPARQIFQRSGEFRLVVLVPQWPSRS